MIRLKAIDGERRGERAVNVELIARYENENTTLKCYLERHDIFMTFSSARLSPTKNLEGGCMQLGWNTVGIFDSRAGQLLLVKLYEYGNNNRSILEGMNFNQAVTRAVHSCTFAHVRIGGYHILAHLDEDCLEWGMGLISDFKNLVNLPAFGFCSHIFGGAENRFSDELHTLCGDRYSEIFRHNNNFNFHRLDENDKKALERDLYAVNRCGHLEIGLSCERHGIVLFGDITNVSNGIGQTQVPTRLFENWEQLSNIYNYEMLNLRRR